jgi:hypothetical protein
VALAQSAGARSIVVLSDMHMGLGRSTDGAWRPDEDFRWSAEFARFLAAIDQEGKSAVDLILNGDTFELVNSGPRNCDGRDDSAGCTETTALSRLDTILKAHDTDVKALGQFARAGSNHVAFVPGDQDAALLYPGVGRRAVAALAAPGGRAEVTTSGYWLSPDGQVYAEHGHQIGFSAHRFEDWPVPFVTRSGRQQLERPWGEALAQELFGRYENRFPIIDNVAALGVGLKYVVSADDGDAERLTPQLLRYLLFTISWQQFRMELDDGDVQPPIWDLAQVRSQGQAFLVSSLPDDDQLKPLAAKALANGRLNAIALSDDEIIAICDYRAAVRRSRRRLEPGLTQLAPRGPAVAECPRTPETRGAAFEYFWRSRDQMFLRHLATVMARIPRRANQLRVFVHGHTHLPDRGQANANMISGGLLKIPMEGFSPVRGQLTPVVINDGAWQRTITPAQLDRRASEKGASVLDLIGTMKPEDLSPCYSFVQISPANGAPAPTVRYWRQTGDGEWGFAASCAGQ